MKLPDSVEELANVIGRDRALFLIGQLPRCFVGVPGKKANRVILYIPKTLRPDHPLVKMIGWNDANKLRIAFGGEILQPANCREVYRRFRDRSIKAMLISGDGQAEVAELMGVSLRHVRNVAKEIPQEELTGQNDNNPPE